MAAACLGCGGGRVEALLDCGAQPPSNRFVRAGDAGQDAHALRIGQCQDCALIQLQDPMSPAMLSVVPDDRLAPMDAVFSTPSPLFPREWCVEL